MKKIVLFILAVAAAWQGVRAQDGGGAWSASHTGTFQPKPKPKYLNLGFVTQKIDFTVPGILQGEYELPGMSLKSNYGASFTVGRTYFVHRKPVGRILWFGIDWSYFDLNFADYTTLYIDEYPEYDDRGNVIGLQQERYRENSYQFEASMHVGPSMTINPVKRLFLKTYVRYAPSFSGFYGDGFQCGYASYFLAGLSVSYRVISLGIEGRWGFGRYKIAGADDGYGGDYDDYGDYGDYGDYTSMPSKIKMKTKGFRVYLGFRF